MKLLVTGARGQVGAALVALAGVEEVEVVGLDRSGLDITDGDAVFRALEKCMPDIVVNAAAYTAVDRAEDEPELAFRVNRDGAEYVALACSQAGIPLIHLSTDYVFDGRKSEPYFEDDLPNPLGVYGRSKWEGEEAVQAALDRHVILRTSWVFSSQGSNFVRTILRLARDRDELRVVSDQHGCPTPADDIARALLVISRKLVEGQNSWGAYHFAGHPPTTWFAFAQAIVHEASLRGLSRVESVAPISTSQYPIRAQRPKNSVLATDKIEATFGIRAAGWREALPRTISAIAGG
ncbi:MAG: dTDP-4-dehydrorhamnose reductase [Bacteroidetes bacterium]|nr:dTDP-4-dehydrorhamnose reductase [Bacteroidota bacterium]